MNSKRIPIDISKIDLAKMKEKCVDLPGLIEYAHTVGGFAITPTKRGVIKGKAMSAMREQTQDQLDIVLEQMRLLAKQAKGIQSRVEVSHLVYEADMNFQPDIGQEYFLYERETGKNVLSLVAPNEWGNSKGYKKCLAHVKLLSDHTWKIIENFEESGG